MGPPQCTSADRLLAHAPTPTTVQDIARLVAHMHRFNSRIFVTLSTTLRDDQLEAARQLSWQLYDAGVDALIIQAMGLLEPALPPIQLHASTQIDICTPEKARFLQDVKLRQIALARELTLKQIQAVRQATNPQRCTLEFFIHGALCVYYSGPKADMHNGDGLCYSDLQKELVGMAINRAEAVNTLKRRWRVFPKDAINSLKDLRKGLEVNRNRDMNWVRVL